MKNLKKLLCSIVLLTLAIIKPIYGQEDSRISDYLPNFSTSDPSALYFVIPDISIPLYTLKAKGISIPVSISYDPRQSETYVGMGWTLNAGGHIVMETKHRPDIDGWERFTSGTQALGSLSWYETGTTKLISKLNYVFMDRLKRFHFYASPCLNKIKTIV